MTQSAAPVEAHSSGVSAKVLDQGIDYQSGSKHPHSMGCRSSPGWRKTKEDSSLNKFMTACYKNSSLLNHVSQGIDTTPARPAAKSLYRDARFWSHSSPRADRG